MKWTNPRKAKLSTGLEDPGQGAGSVGKGKRHAILTHGARIQAGLVATSVTLALLQKDGVWRQKKHREALIPASLEY